MRVALVLYDRFVLDLQFGCDLVIPFEILGEWAIGPILSRQHVQIRGGNDHLDLDPSCCCACCLRENLVPHHFCC